MIGTLDQVRACSTTAVPGKIRQHQIEENHIGAAVLNSFQRLASGPDRLDGEASAGQARLEDDADLRLVVDDQQARPTAISLPPERRALR